MTVLAAVGVASGDSLIQETRVAHKNSIYEMILQQKVYAENMQSSGTGRVMVPIKKFSNTNVWLCLVPSEFRLH